MSPYEQHLENRQRDLILSDMQAINARTDSIAAEFKSDNELLWLRKLALEIIHLREKLKIEMVRETTAARVD